MVYKNAFILFAYLSVVATFEQTATFSVPLCCSELGKNDCPQTEYKQNISQFIIPFQTNYSSDVKILIEYYNASLQCDKDIENLPLTEKGSNKLIFSSVTNRSLLRWFKDRESFDSYEFCVFPELGDSYNARVCQNEGNDSVKKTASVASEYLDCTDNHCFSKCCKFQEGVNLIPRNVGCFPLPPESNLPNFRPAFNSVHGDIIKPTKNVYSIVSFPFCSLYELEEIRLLLNGSIFLPQTGETIGWDGYCMDLYFFIRGIGVPRVSVCSSHASMSAFEAISDMLYPLGFIISCIFLAVTFVVHVLVPKLRDLQGHCFMSYVGALFMAFLLLSMNRRIQNRFSEQGCLAIGILNQYFLLAAFFWLNIMCYDLWNVVRKSFKMVPLANLQEEGGRKIWFYSLYGWGCPLIISLITLTIQLLPEDDLPASIIRPRITEFKCWLAPDLKVLFLYYNGVVAVLLLLNIIFIVHSAFKFYKEGLAFTCCKSKRQDDGALRVHNRQHLNTFWHRFCLFSLMALNWTTEILSFLPPKEMWILTDLINTIQGVFIFIIFIRSANKRMLINNAWKNAVGKIKKKKISSKFSQGRVQYNANLITRPSNDQDADAEIRILEMLDKQVE